MLFTLAECIEEARLVPGREKASVRDYWMEGLLLSQGIKCRGEAAFR
jgi:hypothetical protein